MRLFSFNMAVGTTPAVLFSFTPSQLNSVAFQAVGAVELGVGGVSIGVGYPIAGGGSFGFNREDVDPSDAALVSIYAVASAPTTVRVFGFMKV